MRADALSTAKGRTHTRILTMIVVKVPFRGLPRFPLPATPIKTPPTRSVPMVGFGRSNPCIYREKMHDLPSPGKANQPVPCRNSIHRVSTVDHRKFCRKSRNKNETEIATFLRLIVSRRGRLSASSNIYLRNGASPGDCTANKVCGVTVDSPPEDALRGGTAQRKLNLPLIKGNHPQRTANPAQPTARAPRGRLLRSLPQ